MTGAEQHHTFPVPAHPGASSPELSIRMSGAARRDTAPELALRRELHARGLRYRVTYRVPGLNRRTIDIAFTRLRLAVFVDGCFWHGCPEHGRTPTQNVSWWTQKLAANRDRDRDTDRHLGTVSWTALRIWEHCVAWSAADQVQAVLKELERKQRSQVVRRRAPASYRRSRALPLEKLSAQPLKQIRLQVPRWT